MKELIRTHRIVGGFDDVAAAMAIAEQEGRLVQVVSARELPGGWVELVAELRDPKPEPTPDLEDLPPLWLSILTLLAAAAVVGGAVWLLVLAVMAIVSFVGAVVTWVAVHLAGILTVAGALLLLVMLCSGHRCEGVHCQGCRR